MKKIFILLALVVSLSLTSCHEKMWIGDGTLVVMSVVEEPEGAHIDQGKYRVTAFVTRGYAETIGLKCQDYVWFNTDSTYHVGDLIHIQ